MARTRQPPSPPTSFDTWWPRLRNSGATILGAFVLVWQTVVEAHAQTVLVVAGVALLGVPASDFAQRWLRKIVENGGGK